MKINEAVIAYGTIAMCLFYACIEILKKYDPELKVKAEFYNLGYFSTIFITGAIIGMLPWPLRGIMLIPTVFIYTAAFTDYFILQIYTLTCVICGLAGVAYLINAGYSSLLFLAYTAVYFIILIVNRIIKALNTGDIEILLALSPYMFVLSNYYKPLITYVELTFLYLITAFIITLIINFKKYFKENKKSFPFAVPACIVYCIMIFCFSLLT